MGYNNCSQSGLESASNSLSSQQPESELYLVNKTLSHGEPVTIKTDGTYNFNTRETVKQAVWDYGTNQYYYGVFDSYFTGAPNMKSLDKSLNDDNNPWNASSYVYYVNDSSKQRHPYIDGNYYMSENKGFMGWHKALSKTGISGNENGVLKDKLYIGFWAQTSLPWFGFRYILGYKSSLGSFEEYNASRVGEQITIEQPDGTTMTGYIIDIDTINKHVEFWTPPGNYIASNKRTDLVITGMSTSAQLITDSSLYDNSPSSIKILRVWDDRDGMDNFIRISVTNDLSGTTGVMDYTDNAWAPVDQSWNFLEFTLEVIDRDLGEIEHKFYLNGEVIASKRGTITPRATTNAPQAALIGLDANKEISGELRVSEIVQDHDFARVYIADTEKWENVTHIEVQRILDWSPEEIKLELNQGSFENLNNKYLFIFNSDNECINKNSGLKIN